MIDWAIQVSREDYPRWKEQKDKSLGGRMSGMFGSS